MLRRGWIGAGLVLLLAVTTALAVEPELKKELIGVAAEEVSVPVVSYVVASPRAFLMSAPIEGTDETYVSAAAENFPRPDGTLEVPIGTRVIFSLSRDTEGIWGADAYGTIETMLTVQWFEAVTPTDCEVCAAPGLAEEPVLPGGAKTGTGDLEESVPCPWITIATDGARDTRNGPSLGYTKVGTPIEFTQPGTYCVRAVVSTTIRTSSPRPIEPLIEPSTKQEASAEPAASLAQDTDVIFVKVRVLDGLDPGTRPPAPTADDPDLIYPWPMPNVVETKAIGPDENDAKDSGAKQLPGPGVFLPTQEYRNVIPF